MPAIPDTQPAIFVAFNQVLAQYRDEVVKDAAERQCRAAVREENRKAAGG